MRHRFVTCDVFTHRAFGGNPLAVLPDARGLSTETMQAIAREFNLSETVFVFPPDDAAHTRRLRIFTPAVELPFAGHPTVGAAYALAVTGEIAVAGETTRIVFEEGVGPVPVDIRAHRGMPTGAELSAARMPERGPPAPSRAALAAALSLPEHALRDDAHRPQAWSCGVPFLIVPLADRAALGEARVNGERWSAALAGYWTEKVYLIAFDADGADLRARMYAPSAGVAEDPATGSAAAALAGYLGAREGTRDGTLAWTIEQGIEMGRPSLIELAADKRDGEIVAVRVGGASVMVSEGTISV
jgi:trans-2,3-dihydro-3-hydroxyanthranilate isomerase